MSGNCATGMAVIAMMPAKVMTMEMTKARRGRSMKMAENMEAQFPGAALAATTWSGPHLLHALDDDQLAFLEAERRPRRRALLGPGRDAPQLDLLRVVDQQDVAAGLVELERGLRDHQRAAAARRASTTTPTNRRRPACPCGFGSGARTATVSVLPLTWMSRKSVRPRLRIEGAVGQAHAHGDMPVRIAELGDAALVVEHVALARLENHVDRVLAHDRRERAGWRTDQIADGEIGEPDAAVDRRVDLGIAEIDLRLVERRLRLEHVGLRRRLVGRALIDGGLRDVLVAHQLLAARELKRGIGLGRLGLGEIGALLRDRRLVGVLLDAEQEVAGLDHLAFGEEALLDEARHARDDVDLVDGGDAADEIGGLGRTSRLATGVTEPKAEARALRERGTGVARNREHPTQGEGAAQHHGSACLRVPASMANLAASCNPPPGCAARNAAMRIDRVPGAGKRARTLHGYRAAFGFAQAEEHL